MASAQAIGTYKPPLADHGPAATDYLKALIGDHYMSSDTPTFSALWNSYTKCQFVENEGTCGQLDLKGPSLLTDPLGDILFYRDRTGRSYRKVGSDVTNGAAKSKAE